LDLNCSGIFAYFDIILSGDSNIIIFLRLENDFSPETIVIYINKEIDSSRKFLNFGFLLRKDKDNENKIDDNFTLKIIRKQEITKNGIFIYLII
jgi:hypothetical protein